MSVNAESITAALKKLGPVSPGQLADHLEVSQSSLGYHLKKLLDAGTIKASGKTNGRRIHLPDQTVDETAPPQPHRRAKKAKGKKNGGRKARAPRSPEAAPAPAIPFVAALTADNRLVLIDGGQAPQIFSTPQCEEIATVLAASGRFE